MSRTVQTIGGLPVETRDIVAGLDGHGTRRTFIGGFAAVAGLTISGCGPSPREKTAETRPLNAAQSPAAVRPAAMTVYRDPSCGCCEAWAAMARNAGYKVNLIDHPDMPAIKGQYGVPDELLSCHTTIVGGYTVEGHVPLEDVARLLKDKSKTIRGIAVAGMPRGSPGMEVPDGSKDAFQVMAFDAAGNTGIYIA